MWHNSGPALIELLRVRTEWSSAACWVHGDTAATRSFLIACRTHPTRKIIWTGAGKSSSEPASSSDNSSPVAEVLATLPLTIVPAERESEMAGCCWQATAMVSHRALSYM